MEEVPSRREIVAKDGAPAESESLKEEAIAIGNS
jgi:hypothetical protein